jgi:subtilisin family serine protease
VSRRVGIRHRVRQILDVAKSTLPKGARTMPRRHLNRWRSVLTLLLSLILAALAPLGVLAQNGGGNANATVSSLVLTAQDEDEDEDEEEDDGDTGVADDDAEVGDDDDGGAAVEPAPEAPVEAPPVDEQTAAQPAQEQPVEPDDETRSLDQPRPNQAIVRLQPDTDPDDVAERYGISVLRSIPERGIYLIEVAGDLDEMAMLAALTSDDEIVWAELNYTHQAPEGRPRRFFTSGDHSEPLAEDQPPPAALNLDAAGCATGDGVTVAVLDTGIDATHPALKGRVPPGYNAILDNDETNDVADGQDEDQDGVVDEMSGHGTHVAGIIAEVAPEADLLPITVLNSDGIGDAFYVAAGIYAAIDEGATVLNLSLSSTYDARVVAEATSYAADQGVLVVAAAGNDDREEPAEFPSIYSDVVSVAATGPDDAKADFSNFHQRVDLSAPGTEIVSAFPGGSYVVWSGTSMAAPFVAGTAALIEDERGGASLGEIRRALVDGVDPIETTDARLDGKLGAGRLDIGASVGCAE